MCVVCTCILINYYIQTAIVSDDDKKFCLNFSSGLREWIFFFFFNRKVMLFSN